MVRNINLIDVFSFLYLMWKELHSVKRIEALLSVEIPWSNEICLMEFITSIALNRRIILFFGLITFFPLLGETVPL